MLQLNRLVFELCLLCEEDERKSSYLLSTLGSIWILYTEVAISWVMVSYKSFGMTYFLCG